MNIDKRIHYDVREFIIDTEQALDNLKIFQYDLRYRELLGEDLIKKIAGWDKSIRSRKDDPFTIVVCGEFKRGKSSLINALLNEEVAVTNVTTETVTINSISYGAHANEIVLSGGRRLTISDEEMRRENLEKLIISLEESITSLEIRRPIDFLKNVRIIDTPGLNDSSHSFVDMVELAINQADAVIYVCTVDSPLSLSEQLFIRTIILPQKYTNIFIIANFADILSDEKDLTRMHDFMSQKIFSLLLEQKVFLLSALDETCRLSGNERPNPKTQDKLADSFCSFRKRLEELLIMKKDTVLPCRIQRLVWEMLHEINSEIVTIEEGLKLDSDKAAKNSEEVKAEQIARYNEHKTYQDSVKDKIFDMSLEAEEWIKNVLEKMRAEIDTFYDITAEDLKKYYSTYCIETVQEAINKCIDYHIESLYDELDAGIVKAKILTSSREDYGFKFSLDNKTWTKGDNISYIASKISQLGLLSLIVDGVAGAMREREASGKLPQILEAIKKQYPIFCESAMEALRNIYGKLNQQIQEQLTEYFSFQEQEITEHNKQLLHAASLSDEKKHQTREVLDELHVALRNFDVKEV